ncbi:MAG: type VI secretion system baseplate subunit TssE [Deltaproteobacteria bacterium]|nr:type VI secretion system baseplate subunit TssE [Deltaproteobacteria bacterium]
MREERLLERLRSQSRDPGRRARQDPKKIVDSVLVHLQRILNTRQGSVLIAEDYGVPDFTDTLRNYPESVREMERSIRQMIQKYESRLRSIRVNFLPPDEDQLYLRFQITAQLALDGEKVPVLFESLVGMDGRVDVKR